MSELQRAISHGELCQEPTCQNYREPSVTVNCVRNQHVRTLQTAICYSEPCQEPTCQNSTAISSREPCQELTCQNSTNQHQLQRTMSGTNMSELYRLLSVTVNRVRNQHVIILQTAISHRQPCQEPSCQNSTNQHQLQRTASGTNMSELCRQPSVTAQGLLPLSPL